MKGVETFPNPIGSGAITKKDLSINLSLIFGPKTKLELVTLV